MNRFEGKVAVVTGAAGGIGRGIARRLAREGASVLIADMDVSAGEETTKSIASDFGVKTSFSSTNVGKKAEVEAMISQAMDELGGVDVLVNNAWGGGTHERFENKSDALMEHGFHTGLMASFWSMKAAFPYMRDRHWGRILNLCTLNGVNAHMYTLEYNTSKEALRTMTRTAAREWAHHGICANVICPAAATAAFQEFADASPENAELVTMQNPMQRMGDPEEDIAPAAAFLCSEDARYVTGNTLYVDGGGHINGVAWAPEVDD